MTKVTNELPLCLTIHSPNDAHTPHKNHAADPGTHSVHNHLSVYYVNSKPRMPVQSRTMDEYHPDNQDANFMIGDVVYINGEGDWRGKVCYLGEVHFAKGEWAGVALDHPMGHHDGTTHHRRYFQCSPNHGIFTRLHRLSRKLLIPETLDAEKYGLLRSPIREYSKSPPPQFPIRSSPPATLRSSLSPTPRSPSPSGFAEERERHVSFMREQSPSAPRSAPQVKVGDRVIVKSQIAESKAGIVRYIGGTDFGEGEWAGIELFYPLGKNDGTVRGRSYFKCEHPFGLFVPLHKVEASPANKIYQRMGTRENLYAVMSATRGVRAGSWEEYY